MDYHANKKWLEMTKKKNEETLNEMKELAAFSSMFLYFSFSLRLSK